MKYLSIILLLLIAACSGDKDKRVSRDNVRFTTSDASELFFKNVRQTSYEKQGLAGSNVEIFRLEDRSSDTDHAVMYPAIALNWAHDEAYILLETNEFLDSEDSLVVNWLDPDADNSGKYIFSGGNKEDNFRSAVDIYTSIQDGHEFTIMVQGEPMPLFSDKEEREVFRKTMLDYFRLVDLIR
ncbi:hypothetical protein AB9P05_08350 [Roseivirga sp. BDSF3-8]|uniref:hypothetical protein n=1 Tax=Roseivirga sp. BDSF3-8 TaxID=3241598 RepID=UPI003531DC53